MTRTERFSRVARFVALGAAIAEVSACRRGAKPARDEAVEVLVVAPHPDDEVLIAGGVLARARKEGKRVAVVVVTNGDFTCERDGNVRQDETIAALASLGVAEDDVIFLGYPDGWLVDLGAAPLPPLARKMADGTCAKTGGTYAHRGAHRRDEHSARTGSPAPYTADALEEDLAAVLERVRPRDVYVTHPIDTHPDHAATYEYLRRALDRTNVTPPRIHRAIVHAGPCWPNGRSRDLPCPPVVVDPHAPWMPLPDPFGAYTPRELLPVVDPDAKLRAVGAYRSQFGDDPAHDWLLTFARAEEAFFPETLVDDTSHPHRRVRAPLGDITSASASLSCDGAHEAAIGPYVVTLDPDGARVAITKAGALVHAWATPLDARCTPHDWEARVDRRTDDAVTEITLWRDGRLFGVAID
jgi:LmbE family N-acetylglucosaminyl deacetylase